MWQNLNSKEEQGLSCLFLLSNWLQNIFQLDYGWWNLQGSRGNNREALSLCPSTWAVLHPSVLDGELSNTISWRKRWYAFPFCEIEFENHSHWHLFVHNFYYLLGTMHPLCTNSKHWGCVKVTYSASHLFLWVAQPLPVVVSWLIRKWKSSMKATHVSFINFSEDSISAKFTVCDLGESMKRDKRKFSWITIHLLKFTLQGESILGMLVFKGLTVLQIERAAKIWVKWIRGGDIDTE